jgi:hypothetical protein
VAYGALLVEPFATDGATTLRDEFSGLFATHESVTLASVNAQYRIVGDTGIAWGHYSLALKPVKGGI